MRKLLLASIVAAAAMTFAAPAGAQDFDDFDQGFQERGDARPRGRDWDRDGDRRGEWRRGILPPRAIIGTLYRRGYRDVDIRRQRGSSYVVAAENRRGSRVILVVDGRTAEITGLRVIESRHQRSFDDGSWNSPRPWSGPRW